MATLARCGWSDLQVAGRSLTHIWRPKFDADANRAALARCLQALDRSGQLVAEVELPPDPATAAIVDVYLRSGSYDALHQTRRAARTSREVRRAQAVRTFEYAGELAPVFGLVGTLFAITQIAPAEGANMTDATLGAVATAVLSSLYGVLTAHFVCIPLGKAIERQGERDQLARDTLFEWFEAQIETNKPVRARIRKVA
ncbi:MotA/TolQ/ExbB proton channel family protein [Erythrobacter sp. F6033]|uniref:MotA/TolQ/ExbB proton channel family protein n=1 Tax=Erythrobacter sp. F6033 TaxID=2926401 RepID=UPI001FF6F0F0|nr:MotA/TolQ/ExbB proton channel family protein [Erythrobacter sp. F6033]MCK0129444.1 MotA/TolQ/ExbB proton channel family protein [Erythrobacter sp. F6033]